MNRTPDPPIAPVAEHLEGAYETPDRQWRVEAVRRGGTSFFRLGHVDNIVDDLDLEGVEELLAQVGISMADLVPAGQSARSRHPGVA